MRSFLAAPLILAVGCSGQSEPANNVLAEIAGPDLPDSKDPASAPRPAALEGLRAICFDFDARTMTEATVRGMIRSIEAATGAYQRFGVSLSHQISISGTDAAIDKCRAAGSAAAGAGEILIVGVSQDNGGTKISSRRGGEIVNSRSSQEPKIWITTYLDNQIGRRSPL